MASKTNVVADRIIGDDDIESRNAITLKEITTPSAKADYGKVYTKSDNKMYFQDGAGVEHTVDLTASGYAEMYLNANAAATTIETANTPIMLRNFTTGLLSNWTYVQGSTGAITAYADGTGKVNVTSAGHGLATGDIISIRGTTNYNGVWVITYIDADNFSIPDTWVADDGASDWDEGDYLLAGAAVSGLYNIIFQTSMSEGGAAGSTIKMLTYVNGVACPKCTSARKFANNDQGSMSGGSIHSFAAGDRVSLSIESSGVNAVTCQYGDMRICAL